jgi:hypothetical protein
MPRPSGKWFAPEQAAMTAVVYPGADLSLPVDCLTKFHAPRWAEIVDAFRYERSGARFGKIGLEF